MAVVPGQRQQGMTMVGAWVDAEFVRRLHAARRGRSISDFARDAVAEACKSAGYPIPPEHVRPPDRAGKGGPRKTSSGSAGAAKADRKTKQGDAKAARRGKAGAK